MKAKVLCVSLILSPAGLVGASKEGDLLSVFEMAAVCGPKGFIKDKNQEESVLRRYVPNYKKVFRYSDRTLPETPDCYIVIRSSAGSDAEYNDIVKVLEQMGRGVAQKEETAQAQEGAQAGSEEPERKEKAAAKASQTKTTGGEKSTKSSTGASPSGESTTVTKSSSSSSTAKAGVVAESATKEKENSKDKASSETPADVEPVVEENKENHD